MKYSAKQFVKRGFLLALICMGVFVWITYYNMQNTLKEGKSVSIALKSLRSIEAILNDMQNIESGQQGYIITGDDQDLEPYFRSIRNISEDSVVLRSLVADDSSRAGKINELESLLRQKIAFTDSIINVRNSAGYEAAAEMIKVGNGRTLMNKIRGIIFSIENLDRSVLRESNAQRLLKAKHTTVLFLTLSGIFFIVITFSYFIILGNLNRQHIYQEELAYLSSLVKQTSETIFSTDPHFIIKSWNKAAEKMYGYSAEEAVGKEMNALFEVHLDVEAKAGSLKVLQQNGFYQAEYEVTCRNGQSIYVEASVTVLQAEDGSISGYVAVHKDITARVKLETRLQQLNEELEEKVNLKTAELTHIFERITDAFIALDKNGNYIYVNKRAAEIFNADPATMLGKQFWSLFTESMGNKVYEHCQKALAEQRYCFLEDYYLPFGKWFEYHIYPSPNGTSIFFRDITEEKKAQEQILKEKDLSDSIINSLPGVFYLFDESGKFIRWNKNFETISGYNQAEIREMNLFDFYDVHDTLQNLGRIDNVTNGQKMQGIESLLFTKTKKSIPFYFNSLAIVYEGSPCTMVMGTDITDRKKAEEENRKLAMIASLTINSVILMNTEGDIQWVNKGFERISKYTFGEVVGKKPGAFLHGAETNSKTVMLMQNCAKNKKSFKGELLNYNKVGEKYWLDIEVVPIRNDQNILTGFMSMQRDITDRKIAEEELLQLNRHLQERAAELAVSNSELERFAYVASHDLQEPLRMVTGFMHLLKKNYENQLDDKAGQYISFAIDGAERMRQLIKDLLEYSRIGTNKEIFERTNMKMVLQEVAGVFVKPGEENAPEIIYPDLPEINANKSQMAQLMQNLIGNAVKYKSGQNTIVRINCKEENDDFLFSVGDNGIGIDPAHFDRIFVLFQRLHLKEEYSGTGIGLTICKKIVERHGGNIWVESEPGKGSTFYFTIKKQLEPVVSDL